MPNLTSRALPPSARRLAPVGGTCPARRRAAAFTLVELLVVIGVALLLMGILLPAITKAMGNANRAKMAFDLQAIVVALEAYRQDHGDIPRTSPDGASPNYGTNPPALSNGYAGAQILCRAMVGPGNQQADGAGTGKDGEDPAPGFRTRPAINNVTQGKVYGPYLAPDKFQIGNPDGSTISSATPNAYNFAVLVDRRGKPILYFPGLPTARVESQHGYVGAFNYGAAPSATNPRPMFDVNDNHAILDPTPADAAKKIQLVLGDNNTNGQINAGETPAFKGPYLLLSAGPDELFGPADLSNPISAGNRCDDVLNFDRSPAQ